MALVVLLRGMNVGGHRRFRPSLLAAELSRYDVINVGATGTFLVRRPGSRADFRNELLRRLPCETEVFFCDGRDILRMEIEDPFRSERVRGDVVRFVSVLSKIPRQIPTFPISFPPDGDWYVRLVTSRGRFIFGMYRRHMKTIGYLGKVDKLFGVPSTTRNWNTITTVVRLLKVAEKGRLRSID